MADHQRGGTAPRFQWASRVGALGLFVAGVILTLSWMHPSQRQGLQLLSKQSGWQTLAVWNGDPQEEEKAPTGIQEPEWLSHYVGHMEGSRTFGETEGELDEVKALRGRMSEAEKQLQDAQAQLERAQKDLKGHNSVYAGSEVQGEVPKAKPVLGPTLSVSPRLIKNGQVVVAEWEGLTEVTEYDFIGVYSPPSADNHDYVELHNVTDCETWAEGKGKLHLRLFNHRKRGGYELRYFRSGKFANDRAVFLSTDSTIGTMLFCPHHHCKQAVYFLVTSSPHIVFPAHEPTQTRLALTGNPTEMRVMWVSDKCPGSPLGGALVLFSTESCNGKEECGYEHHVKPLYRTYSAEDLCGPPANVEGARGFIDPGFIYDVVLTDLEPGTRYYYRVGCQDGPDGWKRAKEARDHWQAGSMMSEEKTFVAPPWTKATEKVSFIAYADSGVTTRPNSKYVSWGAPEKVNDAILKEVDDGNVGLVLHMGGMSYSHGKSKVWEEWGDLVEPIAEQVPYMVTNGNLEYDHLPVVSLVLSKPDAANKVRYYGRLAPFGLNLMQLSSATGSKIVVASGNTSTLCSFDDLTLEDSVQAREEYGGALVVVGSGDCDPGAKAHLAQVFGAVGVIMHSTGEGVKKLEKEAKVNASKWSSVSIPTILISEDDGEDLAIWVRDHGLVEGTLHSSEHLQQNDPSLTYQEKAISPSGYHPSWSQSFRDDSKGECGVPFAQRFHMPENGNGNFWYSFEYGSVTFVVVSTEHDLAVHSRQYNWLKATLSRVDRSATPWLVVSMHRSIYGRTLKWSWQEVSNYLQKSLEPLFKKYHVDLVLSGQERRYLRTAPVYMDLNVEKKGGGPTYMVVGTGGGTPFYRARDGVHRHYYCVGGYHEQKRCDCNWGYYCNNHKCCDYELNALGFGHYVHCGYCERINATGPGAWRGSSPAGPRDPHSWGWVRSQHSGFGYARLTVESSTRMKVEWVQSFEVWHKPTVDAKGRSLHVPYGVDVGCRESCSKHGNTDGKVADSFVVHRKAA